MSSLQELLSRNFIYFRYYFSIQFGQIFPYWALGMALGSLVAVFGKEKIQRAMAALHGKKIGALGILPASLLGIVSPLCMYGTIPIAASFSEKGMEDDWIAAFAVSSVLLNPQLLFYTAALGWPAVVIRFTVCFVCGITAGFCVRYLYKGKRFFSFAAFGKTANRDTDPNPVIRFLKNYGRNIRATGLYFLAGVALSAAFQTFVPNELSAKLFGGGGLGVLMAATVGVPLYVCGGGTIPLLQAWMKSGMSLGAATAFMITGPAMKITNLGALKMILGIKRFLLYLLYAILFALLCGGIVNLLLMPH